MRNGLRPFLPGSTFCFLLPTPSSLLLPRLINPNRSHNVPSKENTIYCLSKINIWHLPGLNYFLVWENFGLLSKWKRTSLHIKLPMKISLWRCCSFEVGQHLSPVVCSFFMGMKFKHTSVSLCSRPQFWRVWNTG